MLLQPRLRRLLQPPPVASLRCARPRITSLAGGPARAAVSRRHQASTSTPARLLQTERHYTLALIAASIAAARSCTVCATNAKPAFISAVMREPNSPPATHPRTAATIKPIIACLLLSSRFALQQCQRAADQQLSVIGMMLHH